jgi:hypothetical protein
MWLVAALLQAFGRLVDLWGIASVLQCGLALSRGSYSFSNQPKIVNGDYFLRLVA